MAAADAARRASAPEGGREIVITRVFDAPRDLVFRMWTEPEHVARWWGPRGFTSTIHEMDVRPGGVWSFVLHGPDGRDYPNRSIYREVVRPERLAFTHVSGPLFEFEVTFTDRGGTTEVTARMVFATGELRDRVIREFGAADGLTQNFEKLAEHLAA